MFSEVFCILNYLVARALKKILGFFALWQELNFFIELFMRSCELNMRSYQYFGTEMNSDIALLLFDDQKWA